MSDPIEEMFARTRQAGVLTIRPPGVEAARRTVRFRRRRRVASLAAVVTLALLGGAFARMAVPGPERKEQPPATPLELSRTAKAALGHPAGPVAFEKEAEAEPGWSTSSPRYLGELTLLAACAGTGQLTLAVIGTPGSESLSTDPVEVTRLDVPCAEHPLPVTTRFVIEGFVNVDYKLLHSPAGAGFAFRVTSVTGEPLTDQNDEANTTSALHLTEEQSMNGYGLGAAVGYDRRVFQDELPSWIGGRFKVFTACAGLGSIKVQILRAGGKVVDTETVPCQWPPKRHDWAPARGIGDLRIRITYLPKTDSRAPVSFAVQFEPKR
jgi:hypothetical protein